MSNKNLAVPCEELTILVTGGAGFIGSHTCVELLNRGYSVVIVDNLSNSSRIAIDRVQEICFGTGADGSSSQQATSQEAASSLHDTARGCAPTTSSWQSPSQKAASSRLAFYECDILDREGLEHIFAQHNIDAIIHFAGLKAVGESTQKPLEYYWNNVAGSLVLFDVARAHGVKNVIFSSSATVYGDPEMIPITEDCPLHEATNPYGETKAMVERILTDLYRADGEWNIVLLRYFNPIGAHESGKIGEDPKDIPNNLLPYVAQVAVGKLKRIGVFGNDYPTPDGTGVRDYIHVVDLARGHVKALDWMGGKVGTGKAIGLGSYEGTPQPNGTRSGVGIFNLGTGKGSSVLEVIAAFEKACGKKLPYVIEPRRPGDIAENYAACEKARTELGWVAEYDLDRMCQDSWRWQSHNPQGYESL